MTSTLNLIKSTGKKQVTTASTRTGRHWRCVGRGGRWVVGGGMCTVHTPTHTSYTELYMATQYGYPVSRVVLVFVGDYSVCQFELPLNSRNPFPSLQCR